MKINCVISAILFFLAFGYQSAGGQNIGNEISAKNLILPQAEEIAKIEISKTSAIDWYKSEELRRLLPRFAAVTGTYSSKQPFQRGTFILKNGKTIMWMANGKDSILLYQGSREQLFRLPKLIDLETMFPIWDKNGKSGFINVEGKITLSENNAVGEFSENLAPVMIGDKWGYINNAGEIVITPRWKNNDGWLPAVGPFNDGLAAVIEYASWGVRDDSNYWTYKCGYINTKGEYVIQPKIRESCGTFSDGLAVIAVDTESPEYKPGKGPVGYLNTQDKWAIEPRFFSGTNFRNGVALVRDESGEYFINQDGRRIAKPADDCRWKNTFQEGLSLTYTKDGRQIFIDEQCRKALTLASDIRTDGIYSVAKGYDGYGKYASSAFFSKGLLPVQKSVGGENVFGFLDRTGKTAINFKFADATPFFDGLAGVVIKEQGNKYNAYIDHQGKIVLKNTRGIAPFYHGLAFHLLNIWTISESPNARNIYGYMNKRGKYVWLSPGAKIHLDEAWIKQNYIGPTPEREL